MNTSSDPVFPAGKQITGKWNGRNYIIQRKLGQGANGQVYLVSCKQVDYAMKIGADTLDIQSEVNILKLLSEHEGSFFRFLIDVDDYHEGQRGIPFYVMKYVDGIQLQTFLSTKGREWFPLIGLRLLDKLCELHAKGLVFGDLKRENILVSGYGQVELVDFGGVTFKERSVKQFTELYDRAYWNAGDRNADEGYDLFSFAVLCIYVCADPKVKRLLSNNVLPQNRSMDDVLEELKKDGSCKEYLPFLTKAITGQFKSSADAHAEWRNLVRIRRGNRSSFTSGIHSSGWLKIGFAASLLLLMATLWYYW